MAATKEDIDRLQASLNNLLQLNTQLKTQVDALQEENSQFKKTAQTTLDRIKSNKEKWQKCEEEIAELAKDLTNMKLELEEDEVERAFSRTIVRVTKLSAKFSTMFLINQTMRLPSSLQ